MMDPNRSQIFHIFFYLSNIYDPVVDKGVTSNHGRLPIHGWFELLRLMLGGSFVEIETMSLASKLYLLESGDIKGCWSAIK